MTTTAENSTTHRSAPGATDAQVPWSAHCTLWGAAVLTGVVTSLGVWLFLQGFAMG